MGCKKVSCELSRAAVAGPFDKLPGLSDLAISERNCRPVRPAVRVGGSTA